MSSWWEDAVFYEIYIRSFSDSNGDGIGDLRGIRSRLGYLRWLGVDALWITPFYSSPMADHGYDVADYRSVDPMFGDMGEADALLKDAHEHGMRVIFDIVPNHTSDQHPWFQRRERDKYIFRDQPNSWVSVFGGPAWTFDDVTDEYYLHLFTPEQPDLNWRNPEVHEEFDSVLRFWLDRGIDGFRIDVAHGLYKDEHLRDGTEPGTAYQAISHNYAFDQPEVHDVYRRWRRIADSYGDRVLVGEVFLFDPERVALYVRPDELHLAFNFYLMAQPWDAGSFRNAIETSMEQLQAVGAGITWVLSNHDLVRHRTRHGSEERARAVLLLLLALPGAVFLYQGEELGLEEADVPDERKQDPIFLRTNGARPGRDGCRVPIPWDQSPPAFGFTSGEPWLPAPQDWGRMSVGWQREDPGSMLSFYRAALAARKNLPGGGFEWRDAPPGCLAFAHGTTVCALNLGREASSVEVDGKLILASSRGVTLDRGKLTLPSDSSAWVSERMIAAAAEVENLLPPNSLGPGVP